MSRNTFATGVSAVSSSLRLLCLGLLGVVGTSLLEFRAVDLIQARNLPAQVDVAAGVLAGRPYWKAYQNRLLGPAIVASISPLVGGPLADVYRGFCFAALCAANALAFALFRRADRGFGGAWGYVAAYAGLFVALQDPEWLYLWDYVDLVTMLLFAWGVVMGGWTGRQWTGLFLVELANRESAQFIALWLVLDALLPEQGNNGTPLGRWVNLPRLLLGAGLGVVASGWTHFIRNALCQGEVGVLPRPEIIEFADGQFFMGRVTLDLLRDPWNLAAGTLAALVAILGCLLWQAWSALGPRAWKVAALLAALVVANLCFSFIYELRVWFVLTPFVVCLGCRWQTGTVSSLGFGSPAKSSPAGPPAL